ncbi:MAG: hypothetical protein A4E57_00001 [Syntrophorhabdaceae bacterium PtaU1.Bin034]|nr:MAG: hypothetical protein A4E57_00001 [Syntrophorhabdaceae bacterium PtaU1.Bin034]
MSFYKSTGIRDQKTRTHIFVTLPDWPLSEDHIQIERQRFNSDQVVEAVTLTSADVPKLIGSLQAVTRKPLSPPRDSVTPPDIRHYLSTAAKSLSETLKALFAACLAKSLEGESVDFQELSKRAEDIRDSAARIALEICPEAHNDFAQI